MFQHITMTVTNLEKPPLMLLKSQGDGCLVLSGSINNCGAYPPMSKRALMVRTTAFIGRVLRLMHGILL
jgi:hypothetical protein